MFFNLYHDSNVPNDYFKTNNKGEDSGIIELETHKYSDDKLHCEYMNNKYQHKLNWNIDKNTN